MNFLFLTYILFGRKTTRAILGLILAPIIALLIIAFTGSWFLLTPLIPDWVREEASFSPPPIYYAPVPDSFRADQLELARKSRKPSPLLPDDNPTPYRRGKFIPGVLPDDPLQ